jgi:DNA-binding ferritin-like protein (Dps family)
MKLYISILLFSLLVSVAACKNPAMETVAVAGDHYETIQVPETDSSYANLDSALNFSDFIVLKPDPQINVSSLSDVYSLKRIMLVDTTFFILDIKYMTATAYDLMGKYLFTFNTIGKGPGGSNFLLDLFINPKEKAAYLVSNNPSKLMKYTLDGTLVREYLPPFYPSSMSKVGDKYYFDLNFNFTELTGQNNFLTTDTSFKLLGKFFPYELEKDKSSYLYYGGLFTVNDSQVYYSPGKSNAIYQVEDGTIAASYIIRFPHDTTAIDIESPQLRAQNEHQLINRLFRHGNFIGFNYDDDKTHNIRLSLYNFSNKQFFKSKTIDLFGNALIYQSENKIIIGVNVKDFYDKLKAKMNVPGTYPAWYEKVLQKMNNEKIDNSSIGIIICSIA